MGLQYETATQGQGPTSDRFLVNKGACHKFLGRLQATEYTLVHLGQDEPGYGRHISHRNSSDGCQARWKALDWGWCKVAVASLPLRRQWCGI